jgi:hypothetical protein
MTKKYVQALLFMALAMLSFCSYSAELDPKVLAYVLPENVKWKPNAAGTNETMVLYGDPDKAGPYAVLLKWKAGNMSRPHFHPNDRHIMVMKGTWWVGTGPKYDPATTVPMPAGSYVLHYGKGIHYDGAKDGDAIIMLHGIGPATNTPAEQK